MVRKYWLKKTPSAKVWKQLGANQSKGDFFYYEKRCFQLEPLSTFQSVIQEDWGLIRYLKAALDGGFFGIWTRVIFHNLQILFCVFKVSVSTTNSTKSHFKAHFSLSFATVSLAVVSLYFKCALKWCLGRDSNSTILRLWAGRFYLLSYRGSLPSLQYVTLIAAFAYN